VTDAEKALRDHGHRTDRGRWWFTSPHATHSEQEALAIAEACLMLDMPVTDILTSRAWLRLVDRVVQLQERLDRLERA
jgi:hypothetical protein